MKLFQWVTPRRRPWVVATAVVVAVYGATGGCYAEQRPPALTAAEQALLDQPPLPYAVSVVPWDSTSPGLKGRNVESYAKTMALLLKNTGAFTSVQLDMQRQSKADLVAASTGDYCSTAAIPVFSIVTLGIVPTIFRDVTCEGATFRRAGDSTHTDSVTVHYTHEGRVITGWLAIPAGFLPGWSHGAARGSRRFHDRTRLEILKQRDALAQMVKR